MIRSAIGSRLAAFSLLLSSLAVSAGPPEMRGAVEHARLLGTIPLSGQLFHVQGVEVDAAHIWPVERNGPDVVTNGLALSGTAHWMFDRGLISLSDDLDILISRHANVPDAVHSFINKTGRAIPPLEARDRPHPRFLAWHRENCFKS